LAVAQGIRDRDRARPAAGQGGADLRGVILSETDLCGVELSRAFLSGANLRGALLRKAGMRAIDLNRADLRGADLRWADLCAAVLSKAILSGADLQEAVLRGAVLTEADLRGADLRGADLTWTDLRRVDLSGAALRGADLSAADMRGTVLDSAAPDLADCERERKRVAELENDKQRLVAPLMRSGLCPFGPVAAGMERPVRDAEPTHLGDGAYACIDSGMLRLTANHHDPNHASGVVFIQYEDVSKLLEYLRKNGWLT
jgi:hypothetical protein